MCILINFLPICSNKYVEYKKKKTIPILYKTADLFCFSFVLPTLYFSFKLHQNTCVTCVTRTSRRPRRFKSTWGRTRVTNLSVAPCVWKRSRQKETSRCVKITIITVARSWKTSLANREFSLKTRSCILFRYIWERTCGPTELREEVGGCLWNCHHYRWETVRKNRISSNGDRNSTTTRFWVQVRSWTGSINKRYILLKLLNN